MATRGRGRPRVEGPDVPAIDALDAFNIFRSKGISVAQSASAAMYAVVAQVVGWDNLGISHDQILNIRKMYIAYGINPDRIEGVDLSDKRRAELTAGMQLAGLENNPKSTGLELGSLEKRESRKKQTS